MHSLLWKEKIFQKVLKFTFILKFYTMLELFDYEYLS